MRGRLSTCSWHQWRPASSSTFRAIARVSKVEFARLDLAATGTVARRATDGVTCFTDIILRPRLTVPAGTNRERVLQLLAKSANACLVSASLSTAVRVEPEIDET